MAGPAPSPGARRPALAPLLALSGLLGRAEGLHHSRGGGHDTLRAFEGPAPDDDLPELEGSLFVEPWTGSSEAHELLARSPASCFSVDEQSNITFYRLHPRDFYDHSTAAPLQLYRTETASCKAATVYPQYGVMVPVHAEHKEYYKKLVASLKKHKPEIPIQLITTFTSLREAQIILGNCDECYAESGMDMRTLVFNILSYTVDKFNFQAAKKLWALEQATMDHIMVLDSDFVISQPINMKQVVNRYERVLFRTASTMPIDQEVLANVNQLLNTGFDIFPMELPWVYNQNMVTRLIASLKETWNTTSWVPELIWHQPRMFEIVLYNLWILKNEPSFFTTQIDTRPLVGDTFIFEADMPDSKRMLLAAPPPGTTCRNQRIMKCETCWIVAHSDRC
mmetsp:Transcript_61377/g.174325  ORF Transcript_61377/g.174325 Transcript_61377/m.174325 type:complete len:394 (+) Transcript_61377:43-1224(+)